MVDWDVPNEPKVSLGDEIKPMRSNVPVGRLATPYNRDPHTVFVKKVTRGNPPDNADHYYVHVEGYDGGYVMSQDVLDQLDLHEADLVYIYEEDTGTVLEFDVADFDVPVDTEYSGKAQQLAPENEATYRWEGLGSELFTNHSFWSKQ